MQDPLIIANHTFSSRLILGTGKFSSPEIMKEAVEASECEMVTVALRRVDFKKPEDHLLSVLDPKKTILLPNTSGARDAEEAVRLARLARSMGLGEWIKLEVTPDPKYLLPDGEETLKAARILVKEGFKVMPYMPADFILAKKLEESGTVSVMPLGSPIGSNQGLKTLEMIRIILEESRVPVIVDAGIGAPSDAAKAMEIGASAVLVNTAIASASTPSLMAEAFKHAVRGGRQGYLSGLPLPSGNASPSSTLDWISRL